ncbi:MAG: mechanosensitive ion channel family protein [Elusimicrobiota bacterium]|jgi:miniconductance mechanosensitive channel|nr:mechanosensitive ion channel family protein [Elusimicrobiota bacterium]
MNWLMNLFNNIEIMRGYPLIAVEIILIISLVLFLNIIAFILRKISRKYLYNKLIHLKDPNWNKAVKETDVITTIGYLVSGFVILFGLEFLASDSYRVISQVINKIINVYFQFSILILINKVLNVVIIVNSNNPHVPLKGILQFVKIFFNFFGVLIILAFFIGKEPTYFISALGLIASILLIVFKDTILGLTASWQLAMNKMLYIGDWITMPKHNVDGEVKDISLTSVSVKNFDNTIISVPAYDLISNSFQNWKGMQESGARRIKRAIYIDIQSIKFLDSAMVERLKKIELIRDYLSTKENELKEINAKHDVKSNMINGMGLTNIGTFRIYCEAYVKSRTFINLKFTAMVRQLPMSAQGLPLEIYCFAATTEWTIYEKYQSDIFDHLLAVMKEFDLNVFQELSGNLNTAFRRNSKK